ncbi:hypothetical protein GOBAR_AA22887 [Gossypium barbadense]|uniref:Uncharacterized protein n=1 Tax=Gossypium barbadense TaxID=3634 RepID=A0A2P5X392_GOSBA|nr:hypothetical protein GOBAR_AA22887 [Gossypium barbadense]
MSQNQHPNSDCNEASEDSREPKTKTGRCGGTRVAYGGVQGWYGVYSARGLVCGAERMGLGLGFPRIFKRLGLSGFIFWV